MPWTWLLRIGLVVHRESIPLSEIRNLTADRLWAGDVRHRNEGKYFVPVSDNEALFSVARGFASDDEPAVVTKGRVVVMGGNAEIVYRASLRATIFLTLWFGLLIAGEIGIWLLPPGKLLTPALTLLALMAGAAFLVRRAIRVEVGLLRGIALEAVMHLRN